jgi:hypothetical protein
VRGRWLVTLIALPLVGGAVLLPLVRQAPSGRVYTVAEFAAGLAHRPSAWVGRVLLVRGWVRSAEVWVPPPRPQELFSVDSSASEGCFVGGYPCPSPLPGTLPSGSSVHLFIYDTLPATSGMQTHWPAILTLRVQAPAPSIASNLLQRILALLHLAAGSQRVRWGYPATYRVVVLPRTIARCYVRGPCDDGVLLDARAR